MNRQHALSSNVADSARRRPEAGRRRTAGHGRSAGRPRRSSGIAHPYRLRASYKRRSSHILPSPRQMVRYIVGRRWATTRGRQRADRGGCRHVARCVHSASPDRASWVAPKCRSGTPRRSGSPSDTAGRKGSARPPRGRREAPGDDARVSSRSPAQGGDGGHNVRVAVAFLTNDSADRVRSRLVITEAGVQYAGSPANKASMIPIGTERHAATLVRIRVDLRAGCRSVAPRRRRAHR